jgi:serine/threonine protein kinase
MFGSDFSFKFGVLFYPFQSHVQGMSYLHGKCQIIHTDIKPENVLVALDPREVARMAADKAMQHQQRGADGAGRKRPAAFWDHPEAHQELNVKIADLGNACWTVSFCCLGMSPCLVDILGIH